MLHVSSDLISWAIIGEAQKAKVDLSVVERGEGNVMPGELSDNTAKHMIRFDDLNPFTYTDRTVVVKNCTYVVVSHNVFV